MVDKVWQGYDPGKNFASSLPNRLHKSYHIGFLEDIVQREAQQGSTYHIIDIDIELAASNHVVSHTGNTEQFCFQYSRCLWGNSQTCIFHLPASTSHTEHSYVSFLFTMDYPGWSLATIYIVYMESKCVNHSLKSEAVIPCICLSFFTWPIFDAFSQPQKQRICVGAPRKGCDAGLPHCQFRQVLLTQRTGPCMGGYTIKRL